MRRVAYKIAAGYAVIVLISTFAMVMAFRAVVRVEREMNRLAQVHEPVKVAAHEMEINMKGVALGTLAYLSAPDPKFRTIVADAETDFLRFHAEYVRLAAIRQEKEYGAAVSRLFEQFRKQSFELTTRRDEQAEDFKDALARLEETDRIFDQQLPAALNRRRAEDQGKLENISTVDEGIDAIRMHVAIYRWSRLAGQKALIEEVIEKCRAAFERLKTTQWTTEVQGRAVREAEEDFNAAMVKVRRVLADEDEIHQGIARFVSLRQQLDDLLDEDVQPFAAEQVRDPIAKAERLTNAVVVRIGWLMALFTVAAILASLILTRTLTRPLKALMQGTESVSHGDLTHRVPVVSRDEFSRLGQAFNHMVGRLQETLVSKEELEKSEHELRETVQALKKEISDRIRAEEEQRRLEKSLRKSERLAAMGTLVAGVAHQVRNPLFGMCSVLDAMEARLGRREEYRRYMEVLCEQAARVSALMHDLMEYGRFVPGGNRHDGGTANSVPESLVSGPLTELINEAVAACQPLADKADVIIKERLKTCAALLKGDRPRLIGAFQNLIENAIQHSSAGNIVTITATEIRDAEGAWVEVKVEDSGSGFRDEDMQYVFEPFFTRRPGGTGLGLALVERIVSIHGGQVSAANRPGGGAVLTVRLPVESSTSMKKHPESAAPDLRN